MKNGWPAQTLIGSLKKVILITMILASVSCGTNHTRNEATPLEVVEKVRRAAKLLAEQGPAGLRILRNNTSIFTWKDTYVFVVDCNADLVLANPAFPEREGGDIKQHTDYNGKQYGFDLCEIAGKPGGGWVEYMWLKPGGDKPMRKISYVMSVEDHPWQLGAGIYNESVSLEELEEILEP